MCTAWDPVSVDRLVDYGITSLKVASADMTNHALLRHMAASGTPMVISTGMSTEGEIRETVDLVRSTGVAHAFLHCQSTYPAPFKDINLAYLTRLAELTQAPVGYSGHERGFHVALAAVALGARIIEKHFTVDRDLEGNDHKVSLLPGEFKEMVQRVREVEEALGTSAPRAVSTGEMMNRVNLAKSLVAARRIEVGEVLTAADVDIKSPGRGLQPNAFDKLVGRTTSRALDAGDFFYATDLGDAAPRGRDYSFRRPWGLATRYHDIDAMTKDTTPDFLEFHFSYKDLDLPVADVFAKYDGGLPMGFTTHSPDLFAGDFLLNLASPDDAHWERSIRELQRVVDTTREMQQHFLKGADARADAEGPVIVASLGGFTTDAFVAPAEREQMYARVAAGLARVDDSGVRLCAQTLPPYPWYMGGQLYCNLFVDPRDTAEFAAALRPAPVLRRLPLQALGQLPRHVVRRGHRPPRAAHRAPPPRRRDRRRRRGRAGRRRRDRLGGAGPAARRDGARGQLHPRDLAGPRQRRRGLLDRPRAAGAMVLNDPAPPTALWVVPVSDLAGVARHVLDVARAGLPGWRLSFLAPPGALPQRLRELGATVTEAPFGPDHGLRASVATLRDVVRRERPAVVHSHLSYADIVAALAVGRGPRLVTTEHGIARDDVVYHRSSTQGPRDGAGAHRPPAPLRRRDRGQPRHRRGHAGEVAPAGAGDGVHNGVDPVDGLSRAARRPGCGCSPWPGSRAGEAPARAGRRLRRAARDPPRRPADPGRHGPGGGGAARTGRAARPARRGRPCRASSTPTPRWPSTTCWRCCRSGRTAPTPCSTPPCAGWAWSPATSAPTPRSSPRTSLVRAEDPAAVAAALARQGLDLDARPGLDGWPDVAEMCARIVTTYDAAGAGR